MDEFDESAADISEAVEFDVAVEDEFLEKASLRDPLVAASAETPFIRSFSVESLFGRYDYAPEVPTIDGRPSRLMLLHGENGAGKTTLLRLLWNVLSPAKDRGHRTALAQVPFRTFTVRLGSRTTIEVKKTEELVGAFKIVVADGASVVLEATYAVTPDNRVVAEPDWNFSDPGLLQGALWRVARGSDVEYDPHGPYLPVTVPRRFNHKTYEEFLVDLGAHPYLLADDRHLHSDDLSPDDRARRTSANRDAGGRRETVAEELADALNRVNSWFAQMTLGALNEGSAGTNSIYVNVLREISQSPRREHVAGADLVNANRLLESVAVQAPRYEEYGLIAPLQTQEFRDLLSALVDLESDRQAIAAGILTPYLESLETRLAALADAERLIRLLVENANRYLRDKVMTYNPRTRLQIRTMDGSQLRMGSLSSGERQLILLLCTTFLARRSGRVFIIDEPELSLSVPWQRTVLRSLLDCTEGTQVQFFVATHSIEMVTGAEGR
ncbi:MAG TPA: AAA family ATPase [Acidimicrobiales bacterium]|nr:AAA family ATPase [Acidimicrobiales bacterium]